MTTRDVIRARRKIYMVVRSIVQVVAGVVAGAVLVGVPTWAVAGQQDDSASSSSGMTAMMSSRDSHHQMMGSMSKMMDDPEIREQMRSLMADSMDEMSGMPGAMSGYGKAGMGQMRDMGRSSMAGRSAN